MSYIVGLTGGIGSGKSTIAELFANLSIPIIDADIIARQVVEKGSPLLKQIVEHFGERVLTTEGELDRKTLRQIIFNDEAEKIWLNNLLHPAIRDEMQQQIQQATAPYVIWVVPLLIENQLTSLCDRVLVVDVTPEIQLRRASQRDNSDPTLIKNIMAAQVDRTTRLTFADDIIENNLPLSQNSEQLKQQVQTLHQHYLSLSQQKEKETK